MEEIYIYILTLRVNKLNFLIYPYPWIYQKQIFDNIGKNQFWPIITKKQ